LQKQHKWVRIFLVAVRCPRQDVEQQMNGFSEKEKYTIDDLVEIMRILRSDGGCPWDREQTHESIRPNVLEEAYEVADAIDSGDKDALCEELGDLLLQVVFHSRMEQEAGGFDFDDVADGICKKLIHRHPHIFADVKVGSAEEVLKNWDGIKKEEKGQQTFTDTLRSVPRAFPALMRAQKVQKRASRAGFDWRDVDGVLPKIAEEAGELAEACKRGDADEIESELGDLLFSVVNLSRFLKVDSEQALAASTDKFIARFEQVEKMAAQRGIDMQSAGLSQLDQLWDEAKSCGL
jgi:tetrapyrrole methylase family protein/MazG family protein